MPARLRSRFPAIAAELKPRVDLALKEAAEAIARDAKQRVPVASGQLRDAIHVERKGLAEYEVVAGDDDAFYGHIVEHGGRHSAPQPFLVPAAESQRERLAELARAALSGL